MLQPLNMNLKLWEFGLIVGGHKSWAVYDTPNMEAFEKFEQEPENLEKVKFNDIETRTVTVPKQTLAFFEKIRST